MSKNLKLGLWAKAYSDSDGNDNVANALYIKYRVKQLKEEARQSVQDAKDREVQKEAKARSKLISSLPNTSPSKSVLGSLGSFRYWIEKENPRFKKLSGEEISFILEWYRSRG